jgi:hypothetical protein
MPIAHFSITRVRSAAACPRIFYFDAAEARDHGLAQVSVTRVWKAGRDESTACGKLLHAAIDQFTRQASADPTTRDLVSGATDAAALGQGVLNLVYQHHVDREALFARPADRQQAFLGALRCYLHELADVVVCERVSGKSTERILSELFGDRHRHVDATFAVGPGGDPVRVTGSASYAFYDRRDGRHRIVDYRLTPPEDPTNDLFQVCVSALLHRAQHGTKPGAAVLYLHPFGQLVERPWEQVYAERHLVYNLLASLREWEAYQEASRRGLKPTGEPSHCEVCRWNKQCAKRLGPKHEGRQMIDWGNSVPVRPPLSGTVEHTGQVC